MTGGSRVGRPAARRHPAPAHGLPSSFPPPPGGPPGYDWRYAPPAPRRSKLPAAGVVIAILLAAAALAIGIVLLVRPAPVPSAAAPTPAASNVTTTGDTTEEDRALCTAIAPMMAEGDRITKGWIGIGKPGTPARDAATPKFITDTRDWMFFKTIRNVESGGIKTLVLLTSVCVVSRRGVRCYHSDIAQPQLSIRRRYCSTSIRRR